MDTLKTQVATLIEQEPRLRPVSIAERLGVAELAVIEVLPDEMVSIAPGEQAQAILESLVGFGPVTTITHSFGSIFEIKAPFPKGSVAHGYYNLHGQPGELHGHLKLSEVQSVALVSKPFMGKDSHYFGFYTEQGNNIFKVYLGRDEKGELFAEQVERFKQMHADLKK